MNDEVCCTLTIAGPGAGKTYSMVDMIKEYVQSLKPSRFLAVITYTNEATKVIRTRLESQLKIPQNVFIGTIHSFLIRFIIEPYAHLYGILPLDKCYIDEVKISGEVSNPYKKKNIEIKKAEELSRKGFITFDKILEKSYELVKKEKVCLALSNRLQYIFIDEYQDSRIYQHLIFKELMSKGKTKIFVIGDPHQSIFYFTYGSSQLKNEPKPSDYESMPIIDLKKMSQNSSKVCCKIIPYNRRSRPSIVHFVNNFNTEIVQEPIKDDSGVPVIFINETAREKLVKKFLEIRKKYNIPNETDIKLKNLFLSRRWRTFEEIADKFGLKKISNDDYFTQFRMSEIMRCIYGILGITRRELINIPGINEISLRKLGFKILKEIDNNSCEDADIANCILRTFRSEFGKDIVKKHKSDIELGKTLAKLRKSDNNVTECCGYYSTIHSAKGLEATSVLMLADTSNILMKWLETDKKKLRTKSDEYRLGYVGFSRARELLCIGCMEEVSEEQIEILGKLNVKIE